MQPLDDADLTHKNYFHDVAWAVGGYFKLGGNAPIEDFFDAAAAGTLPNLSVIDPGFFGGGANDDHPDHDIRLGQALIASVVNALGAMHLPPELDRRDRPREVTARFLDCAARVGAIQLID